ncbi:MAG: ATP12 family protein, partial [Pseudomonadota bacterium]
MSEWRVKRFWSEVAASPVEGGLTITLDGRPVRTPAKAALILPTRALAEAIAAEWR